MTKEWQKFDGNYEKVVQDIKLDTGEIIEQCWPNAGWFVRLKDKQPDIHIKRVVEVRKSNITING